MLPVTVSLTMPVTQTCSQAERQRQCYIILSEKYSVKVQNCYKVLQTTAEEKEPEELAM